MTSCHDCGHENQTKNAAIGAWGSRLNGTAFVYDYINRSIRKYQFYLELVQIAPYLSKPIKRSRRIAMTSAGRNSVYKVERIFDEIMADSMSII
ncbi:hypothetical protein [Pseudoalteromonas luteoviolacea]|uniref:Uncharacterized protein n=1 Tax=Pseudoalteromonas luteoviolacea NCIMB 1942 TaxID=1365253 RepID=A0A167BBD1_9GAMM|nr:hypothetical protein [Pseudoalteromonas luteoviolacea]KZN46339.1 hypothetical protein N482_12605 [Pseudoalteromonas luteoviolacea NCIMB 1942]